MGEYARKNGNSVKLGTCETLFYVTRQDVEHLAATGWEGDGCALDSYLKQRAFRFRLPTIGEPIGDPKTIDARDPDWDNRIRVYVEADDIDAIRQHVEHRTICFHKDGVNFFVPCPYGKDQEPPTRHSGLGRPRFDFIAEALCPRRAIFACPFCDCHFNLHGRDELLARMAEQITNTDKSERANYLAELVMSRELSIEPLLH